MEGALNTADSFEICATGGGMQLWGFGQGATSSFSFMVVAKGQHRAKFYLWNSIKCNKEVCFPQKSEPGALQQPRVVLLPLAWTTTRFPPARAET